jgi:hypothetical protein
MEKVHGTVCVMADTLAIYKQLTAAGIKPKQAEAIAQAIFLARSVRSTDLEIEKDARRSTGVPSEKR